MSSTKVLIITYYWPPSGGSGVQRWVKMAKYLSQMDCTPIIVTPDKPNVINTDNSLEKEVEGIQTIRLPIWEPFDIYNKLFRKNAEVQQGIVNTGDTSSFKHKLITWIRGNLFIPDPRIFWKKPTSKFLQKYIQQHDIHTIITTGPPHSIHLIGLQIKKKQNIQWIADFRDPWSTLDILSELKVSKPILKVHKYLEQKVLKSADEVITVSHTWAKEFKENLFDRKYHVLHNGFDEEDFQFSPSNKLNDKLIISHFGLINHLRFPRLLFRVLKTLKRDYNNLHEKLNVRLIGVIDPEIISEIGEDKDLKNIVSFHPPISHTAVIQAYYESDILLLLTNQSENALGHIPGKLFEYLATGLPILALGNKNGDSASIIKNCKAGITFEYDMEDQLYTYLAKVLIQGTSNHRSNRLHDVSQFSRKNIALQLRKLLR